MKFPFFILSTFLLLSACRKDPSEIPCQKLNIPVSTTLRDIEILSNGTILVCGGEEHTGVIFISYNNGQSWMLSDSLFDNPVNALHFLTPDTGFAADADILIYRTVNGGISWEPFYASSWPLTVNRNLRDIWFSNDSDGFVCGGKNLGNGVLFKTNNKGDSWTFSESNHELRGVCFNDSLHGVICGYSSLMHTGNGGIDFTTDDAGQQYYTGITTGLNGEFWMCDFNGGIFKSSDNGISWTIIKNSNGWNVKNHQLNCIAVSANGRIAVAGPNGFLSKSDDYGLSWSNSASFDGNDILKIKWISETQVIACGKNGGLYKVDL